MLQFMLLGTLHFQDAVVTKIHIALQTAPHPLVIHILFTKPTDLLSYTSWLTMKMLLDLDPLHSMSFHTFQVEFCSWVWLLLKRGDWLLDTWSTFVIAADAAVPTGVFDPLQTSITSNFKSLNSSVLLFVMPLYVQKVPYLMVPVTFGYHLVPLRATWYTQISFALTAVEHFASPLNLLLAY